LELLSSSDLPGLSNYLYTGNFTYGESENAAKENLMFPLARKTTILEEETVVQLHQTSESPIMHIFAWAAYLKIFGCLFILRQWGQNTNGSLNICSRKFLIL